MQAPTPWSAKPLRVSCIRNLVLAALLLPALGLTARAATILQVDFGVNGGQNDVQSGYYDWSEDAIGGWSIGGYGYSYTDLVSTRTRTISGISVSVSRPGGTYIRDIDGTVSGDLGDLLEEGLYTNGGATSLDIIFSGLAAGNYSMVTYHHIQDTNLNWGSSQITVDNGSGFGGVLSTAATSTGLDGSNPGANTFTFTSNGSSPVTVRVSATAGSNDLVLNGFRLDQIPEPSIGLLGVIGMMAARGRRRR